MEEQANQLEIKPSIVTNGPYQGVVLPLCRVAVHVHTGIARVVRGTPNIMSHPTREQL